MMFLLLLIVGLAVDYVSFKAAGLLDNGIPSNSNFNGIAVFSLRIYYCRI